MAIVKEKIVDTGKGITIKIRGAHELDAEKLIAYLNKISDESPFLSFGRGEFTTTVEEEVNFINKSAFAENRIFIIAEHENEIVACLNFDGGLRVRTRHVGEFGISVLKQYWGYGIGRILMEEMIGWAKSSDIVKKINLKVRSDNHRAIKLYESLGFKIEGTLTRDMCIDGQFYDCFFMGLQL